MRRRYPQSVRLGEVHHRRVIVFRRAKFFRELVGRQVLVVHGTGRVVQLLDEGLGGVGITQG